MTRIGIIGTGKIAGAYFAAIAEHPRATLSAVCDADPARAEAAALATGARAFTSADELLDAGVADAVIVSSPPSTHGPITIAALERGHDVICEKPFAIDIDSMTRMLATAENTGRRLTMATKYRFVEDVRAATAAMRAGTIGEPFRIDVTFAAPVDMSGCWNINPAISGGGVLMDNGTHAIDLVSALFGPISAVRAIEGSDERRYAAVEDTAIMYYRAGSIYGRIELSWTRQSPTPWYASIRGSEGTIEVGWREARIRLNGSDEWRTVGNGYNKGRAFAEQIDNFVCTREGTAEFAASTEDARASTLVLDAAYRSLSQGSWCPVQANRTAVLTRASA